MTEGLIQYQLNYHAQALVPDLNINPLNGIRAELYKLKLLGQSSELYQGLGYGNISQRLTTEQYPQGFLITGSQTGHLKTLNDSHYAWVLECEPSLNRLTATGETPPSSEAMTHAVIYQALPSVHAVIHVHWSTLWQQASQRHLLHTAAEVAYGTPAMAEAVANALQAADKPSIGCLAMLGHEDGILAWGTDLESTFTYLIQQDE
jgi:ribulose-5-phosphate 4-epimerase/fuculose-1-phosphate aldolase